jgi:uncharacterized membrane protein YvlD (DUF360 family)
MNRTRDGAAMALLLGGVALAVFTALFLPTLHFRGSDSTLLGLSSWEAVPVATTLKFALLAAAVVATIQPGLRHLRLPLTMAAIVGLFLPPLAAMMAAVSQWTDLRTTIIGLSGSQTPWVDPGWGLLALLGAALLLIVALWREEHPHGQA